MTRWKLLFIWIAVIISLVGLVAAQPPTDTIINTGDDGFEIIYPAFTTYEQNHDYTFDFHIHNKSNGFPIISGVVCELHIYNVSHAHIYNSTVSSPAYTYDYEFDLDKGNFSEVGIYSALINCNNSNFGGFASFGFTVTANGTEATDAQATLYLGLLIIVLILFITLLALACKIDGNDVIHMGAIIEINAKKHLKTALYFLSYIFFIFLTYLIWIITENFLFSLGTEIFKIFFMIAWYGVYPAIILLLAKLFLDLATNKKLVELAKRGLKIREKKR